MPICLNIGRYVLEVPLRRDCKMPYDRRALLAIWHMLVAVLAIQHRDDRLLGKLAGARNNTIMLLARSRALVSFRLVELARCITTSLSPMAFPSAREIPMLSNAKLATLLTL